MVYVIGSDGLVHFWIMERLGGHQRALTPCWPLLRCHSWLLAEQRRMPYSTSSSLPPHTVKLFMCFVSVCGVFFCVRAEQIPKPWGSNLASRVLSFTSHCQTSPPLPALFIPTPHTNLHPPSSSWLPRLRGSPASFLSSHPSSMHCSNQAALVSTLSK